MLTWRWIRAGGDRFRRPVISQATVSIVREGAFCRDHGGGDPSPVVSSGRRQVRYTGLRVRMMMTGRVDRVVMPGRGVRRVIAPALGKALMARGNCWIGGTRGHGRRPRSRRGAGGRDAGRVVRLVIGGWASGGGRSSGCRRGRPEAEGASFPVVPGGAGGGGRVGRQIVISRGIVTPVCLMMVQRVTRGCGGRVVRVLRMMGTVTPAALGASGGRVGMTNDARWSSGGRGRRLDAADFSVGGCGRCRGQPFGGYVERAGRAVARHRGGARRGRAGAGRWCRWCARSRGCWCSWRGRGRGLLMGTGCRCCLVLLLLDRYEARS